MKYSIITPVYNREDCISRCIESVIQQVKKCKLEGANIEHIIVNDGSTDLTDTICKGYAKCNSHIKYISFAVNRGTNAARNAAIENATGDFCIILDSDDYFADNAILTINDTITLHPDFRHYMFAPDDVDYSKSILAGCDEKVLTYTDFLSGRIKTGFIHCISSDIMKHNPFDESVRIYEGVFFLSFYKEAQRMLFTNKVVTIRERGRSDSVTLDFVRTKRVVIERGIKANEILLSRFGDDMKQNDCAKMLSGVYMSLYDNYLLLGQYMRIANLKKMYIEKYSNYIYASRKLKILETLTHLRLGGLYRCLLQFYLAMRYRVFKVKIR